MATQIDSLVHNAEFLCGIFFHKVAPPELLQGRERGGRGSKGILGEGVQSGDIFGLEGASLKKSPCTNFTMQYKVNADLVNNISYMRDMISRYNVYLASFPVLWVLSCPESPLCLEHDILPGGSFHCTAQSICCTHFCTIFGPSTS